MNKYGLGVVVFVLSVTLLLSGARVVADAQETGVPEEEAEVEASPLAVVTGTCSAPKLSFTVANDLNRTTTSTTFVDVPDMVVNFTVGGRLNPSPTCLKVEYSAFVFAEAGRLMFVRAVLDGTVVGEPAPEVQFDGDSDENANGRWARSHAFNFVFTNVAPGNHIVRIQWRSFDGGNIATHRRSVFVHHR